MPYDIDAPLVAHDEALAGDTVFDLRLNHVWRRIVGGILMHAMEYITWSGSAPEIEQAKNWYDEMVQDFYDETTDGGDVDYLGANIGREQSVAIPTYLNIQGYDNETTYPLHDVGGFWSAGDPAKLIVPVGGAGYYYCETSGQFNPVNTTAFLSLIKGVDTVLSTVIVPGLLNANFHCKTVAYFGDGDYLQAAVQANAAGRSLFAFPANPYSLKTKMFRIGL